MQLIDGWWFPTGETHLPAWMKNPKVRMFLNGRAAYQGQKQVAALALCKDRRVAIDVGAHIGLWSFNLAREFEQVHSFEPVEAHRACFRQNVEAENVDLVAAALGDRAGKVSIRTEPTSSGDSRVDGPGEIPMFTLDSFHYANVGLLKIDTEGFELAVLRGAEETIARWKPVIVVEQKRGHAQKYGFGETDAIPYLESLGAVLRKEMSGDYMFSWD